VVAVIDGRDELFLSATETRWHHLSWQWPPEVRIGKEAWRPQARPVIKDSGISKWLGRPVDLGEGKVKLTKVRGRGPVTLRSGKDFVAILFDDDGPLGADTYEVVLSFGQ
jgi:hypothetical protein